MHRILRPARLQNHPRADDYPRHRLLVLGADFGLHPCPRRQYGHLRLLDGAHHLARQRRRRVGVVFGTAQPVGKAG